MKMLPKKWKQLVDIVTVVYFLEVIQSVREGKGIIWWVVSFRGKKKKK